MAREWQARREEEARRSSFVAAAAFWCLVFALFFSAPSHAQTSGLSDVLPSAPEPQQTYGNIRGSVFDQNGAPVVAADIRIRNSDGALIQQVQSDEEGHFFIGHIPSGAFQLTVTDAGFSTQTMAVTVRGDQSTVVPQIKLLLATQVTEVRVTPPREEIAQMQLKEQEHQRIFGIIPNFYVTYEGDAVPLSARQKFNLALKATTDPTIFLGIGIIAGTDQAGDRFNQFGQGAEGYAKRYGASFANFNSGLWIGGAILPSLLKQDPRYFYRGTGTKRSRLYYALSRTVICKGDNGKWQPNYSSIGGDFAAAGLSNAYIPTNNHATLTLGNAGVALLASASINVFEEFVLSRVTSRKISH
jgi:hypothetical protein